MQKEDKLAIVDRLEDKGIFDEKVPWNMWPNGWALLISPYIII